MVGLSESSKKQETTASRSPQELKKFQEESRYAALHKAAESPPIRYKSSGDPRRFLQFLIGRLPMWRDLADSGSFHGKRMLDKTNRLIDSINSEVNSVAV